MSDVALGDSNAELATSQSQSRLLLHSRQQAYRVQKLRGAVLVDGEVTALLEGSLPEGSALRSVLLAKNPCSRAGKTTYVCALERRGELGAPRKLEHVDWGW